MVPIEQKYGTSAAVEMVDFPLPLPARCRACGKRKRQLGVGTVDWRRSGCGETISVIGFDEAASGGHGCQPLIEAGGADAASPTKFGELKRTGGLGECGGDALIDGALRRCLRLALFDDLERQRIGALGEIDGNAGHGGSGAVLDREGEIIAIAAQIEIGIPPGVELGGAAQGLSGAHAAGALFGMMDDDHGDAVATLQLAQIGEQRRHLAAGVLIDAMQPYERIEDKEARLQFGDGLIEAPAVGLEIEPHGGGGDDLDIEIGDAEARGDTDAIEPLAHDVERILGGVEQNTPGAWHGEAPQARNAGRDRDSKVEGEEGFAAFGLAADEADRLLGPQGVDEPALFPGAIGEAPGGLDRKQSHRRRPVAVLVSVGGGEHVSRNSFSSICRASRSAAYTSSSPAMFIRARRLPWA